MLISHLHEVFISCRNKISTDSRNIIPGSIFFALKGENFDGNLFARQAMEKGAAYCVVDNPDLVGIDKMIVVEDVLKTLQNLANFHRNTFSIPIIAITGSNGKTTTKELIAAVLSKKYLTHYTKGNLNNHIGVPLTILNIDATHEIAVIEMGANHQGEINKLCEIANPDFGIITNIGKAHLEGFGGIEGVKKGKSEMYKFISKKKGKIFLHGDDDILQELSSSNDKITYGTKKLYDVVGKLNHNANAVEFAWKTRYKATEIKSAPLIKTQLVGIYNYFNILCAACVGNYFSVPEEEINEAISSYLPENNRSQLKKTEKNILICDYYNANPTSMKAAIENFKKSEFKNKFLILGDMLELGDETQSEHNAIVTLLNELCFDEFILIGPEFHSILPEKSVVNTEKAIEKLHSMHLENKTILLKGSRGMALEKLIPTL